MLRRKCHGVRVARACQAARIVAVAEDDIGIGVGGVACGGAANLGPVDKYCTETTAAMYDAASGIEIGGRKSRIDVVSLDDRNDPISFWPLEWRRVSTTGNP